MMRFLDSPELIHQPSRNESRPTPDVIDEVPIELFETGLPPGRNRLARSSTVLDLMAQQPSKYAESIRRAKSQQVNEEGLLALIKAGRPPTLRISTERCSD